MYTAKPDIPATSHHAFKRTFRPGALTLGVMLPIESFQGDAPTLRDQAELVVRAEQLGFASVGIRDVPLRDPGFGDIGQAYDPWVYLGYLAARTRTIALLTTSIVLPLRHPIHMAKAAASVDQLSGGRMLLGVASGDRAVEFPAFGVEHGARGALFREHLIAAKRLWAEHFPTISGSFGHLAGADLLPKPTTSRPPLLVTGYSQSAPEWIAAHADGWMTYPREAPAQAQVAAAWRQAVLRQCGADAFKPLTQSYYIDLEADPTAAPRAIHLGHRLGRNALVAQLEQLRHIGIHHVVLNLKYGKRPADEVLEEIGAFVLPHFRMPEFQHATCPA
jgi:luciferase-type oxidoreductase